MNLYELHELSNSIQLPGGEYFALYDSLMIALPALTLPALTLLI